MFKIFNKTSMLFLLCLIFVGQTMASSVMVYSMTTMNMALMNKTNAKRHNMDMADHSAMQASMNADASHASNNNTEDSTVADCCVVECQCFASGCSTTALANISDLMLMGTLSTKIFTKIQLLPNQAYPSLFRPPILS